MQDTEHIIVSLSFATDSIGLSGKDISMFFSLIGGRCRICDWCYSFATRDSSFRLEWSDNKWESISLITRHTHFRLTPFHLVPGERYKKMYNAYSGYVPVTPPPVPTDTVTRRPLSYWFEKHAVMLPEENPKDYEYRMLKEIFGYVKYSKRLNANEVAI